MGQPRGVILWSRINYNSNRNNLCCQSLDKFDGKPYQIKGSPAFDTLTYQPVNDRTNETTATKAGKVVMTGTITVAKDGKSRVVTLAGTGANGQKLTETTYYDKQQ